MSAARQTHHQILQPIIALMKNLKISNYAIRQKKKQGGSPTPEKCVVFEELGAINLVSDISAYKTTGCTRRRPKFHLKEVVGALVGAQGYCPGPSGYILSNRKSDPLASWTSRNGRENVLVVTDVCSGHSPHGIRRWTKRLRL
ncbi:uncharacterized protein LOC121863064 [Homarus americanus]|uniref:uncharacterized protein LOC121863064 n=1 Tax=Homarus americanus TaxID=6706 RepID=UPI001C456F62|nr:uncharacterized protein LOC121863064 [Homarus americanus]